MHRKTAELFDICWLFHCLSVIVFPLALTIAWLISLCKFVLLSNQRVDEELCFIQICSKEWSSPVGA